MEVRHQSSKVGSRRTDQRVVAGLCATPEHVMWMGGRRDETYFSPVRPGKKKILLTNEDVEYSKDNSEGLFLC